MCVLIFIFVCSMNATHAYQQIHTLHTTIIIIQHTQHVNTKNIIDPRHRLAFND